MRGFTKNLTHSCTVTAAIRTHMTPKFHLLSPSPRCAGLRNHWDRMRSRLQPSLPTGLSLGERASGSLPRAGRPQCLLVSETLVSSSWCRSSQAACTPLGPLLPSKDKDREVTQSQVSILALDGTDGCMAAGDTGCPLCRQSGYREMDPIGQGWGGAALEDRAVFRVRCGSRAHNGNRCPLVGRFWDPSYCDGFESSKSAPRTSWPGHQR